MTFFKTATEFAIYLGFFLSSRPFKNIQIRSHRYGLMWPDLANFKKFGQIIELINLVFGKFLKCLIYDVQNV